MPTVESIDGIKIGCYPGDHVPTHIHAIYNEYEALIEIQTQIVYAGSLPLKQLKKAVEYVKQNQKDLMEVFYKHNERLRPNETHTENR